MTTEVMKQFHQLSEIELQECYGSGPVSSALISWLILGTYDHLAKKATASCQQNPNQWHCVKF